MAALMLLTFALVAGSTLGYQTFQGQIPNGNKVPHPCKVNFMWPGVGHQNRLGGGVNNQFGLDFKDAGFSWNADICWADSDGDGRTNGQELGDPDCTWSQGQIPPRTENITHPGICDPYDSSQCSLKNSFVECDLEEFNCSRLEKPGVRHIDMAFLETTIPPTETNYYCMTFDLPADQDYHVIATEPIMDNVEVLHHILVYACEDNSTSIPVPRGCGMEAQGQCGSVIGLWTVGNPGICFGENIGFRFGQTSFKKVMLEIHYNNPFEKFGLTDKSGIKLYYQPAQPEVQDMVTMIMGTMLLEIPPGEPRVEVESICKSSCTSTLVSKPAKIYGGLNHMHYMGSEMTMELYRGGRKVADITRDEVYNYDSPIIHTHSPSLDLLPGDEIRTTCVYNSMNSPRHVFYGEATKDEMCNGFVFVYPKDALRSPYCVTFGPQLDVCDLYMGTPIQTSNGQCNWRTFTHFDENYRPSWTIQAKEKCRMDGACRPECRSFVEELVQQHPCMSKEASMFITWRLSQSRDGRNALARVNGCRGAILAGGDEGQGQDGECGWDECLEYCPVTDDHSSYDAAPNMAVSWVKVTVVLCGLWFLKFYL